MDIQHQHKFYEHKKSTKRSNETVTYLIMSTSNNFCAGRRNFFLFSAS